MKIALDHPLFALRTQVQALSQDFFTQFGFNYFQYLRCFDDGSISGLINHTGLIEEIVQQVDDAPVVFSSFEAHQQETHSYWFLWDDTLPDMPVTLAREKYHFFHGLTLMRRSKNYYDMIAVAMPKVHSNPALFYMNTLKAIEAFIHRFENEGKELIADMHQHPIALPQPCPKPPHG